MPTVVPPVIPSVDVSPSSPPAELLRSAHRYLHHRLIPLHRRLKSARCSRTRAINFELRRQVNLIIPVAGVRSEQLIDTFGDARSEGRLHDAIDIAAPAGTPVLAAADGRIVKLWQSERGGTTIYQLGPNQEVIFYYAHLAGYASGLAEGNNVRQGDVIAYVGDTGNAGTGNYHLHFSIAMVSDPKRYWEGTNINPYPLLRR